MNRFLFLALLILPLHLFGEIPEDRLVDSARWVVGKKDLKVEGQRYNWDCSGVIYAVARKSGLDLLPYISPYSGGGVSRLYQLFEDRKLLRDTPRPGDLIFWDNTYDSNGNNRDDDWLTHAGIVLSIAPDGLISYVHHHYRLGIVIETMDPAQPDNPERSSAMRARYSGQTQRGEWSSAHLLRGYARLSQW